MSYASVSKKTLTSGDTNKQTIFKLNFHHYENENILYSLFKDLLALPPGVKPQIHFSAGLEAATASLKVAFSPLCKPGKGLIYYTA